MAGFIGGLSPALGELLIFLATLIFFVVGRARLRRSVILAFGARDQRLATLRVLNAIEASLVDLFRHGRAGLSRGRPGDRCHRMAVGSAGAGALGSLHLCLELCALLRGGDHLCRALFGGAAWRRRRTDRLPAGCCLWSWSISSARICCCRRCSGGVSRSTRSWCSSPSSSGRGCGGQWGPFWRSHCSSSPAPSAARWPGADGRSCPSDGVRTAWRRPVRASGRASGGRG